MFVLIQMERTKVNDPVQRSSSLPYVRIFEQVQEIINTSSKLNTLSIGIE